MGGGPGPKIGWGPAIISGVGPSWSGFWGGPPRNTYAPSTHTMYAVNARKYHRMDAGVGWDHIYSCYWEGGGLPPEIWNNRGLPEILARLPQSIIGPAPHRFWIPVPSNPGVSENLGNFIKFLQKKTAFKNGSFGKIFALLSAPNFFGGLSYPNRPSHNTAHPSRLLSESEPIGT